MHHSDGAANVLRKFKPDGGKIAVPTRTKLVACKHFAHLTGCEYSANWLTQATDRSMRGGASRQAFRGSTDDGTRGRLKLPRRRASATEMTNLSPLAIRLPISNLNCLRNAISIPVFGTMRDPPSEMMGGR